MKALLFCCLILSNVALAQSVSITPNQGVKFPRYSSAAMLAITTSESGSTIFNTETNTLWTYTGIAWKNLGSGVNGTKMQTFMYNSVSWTFTQGAYSRIYTATISIPELSTEVLNSGLVDIAYVPYGSNTLVFKKIPDAQWGVNLFAGTQYTLTRTFSYELNTVSFTTEIPGNITPGSDYLYVPQQIKVTLISPNPNN